MEPFTFRSFERPGESGAKSRGGEESEFTKGKASVGRGTTIKGGKKPLPKGRALRSATRRGGPSENERRHIILKAHPKLGELNLPLTSLKTPALAHRESGFERNEN